MVPALPASRSGLAKPPSARFIPAPRWRRGAPKAGGNTRLKPVRDILRPCVRACVEVVARLFAFACHEGPLLGRSRVAARARGQDRALWRQHFMRRGPLGGGDTCGRRCRTGIRKLGNLFAAIIGSISFWGSIIAFLKLQETLKRRFADPAPGQRRARRLRRRARRRDRRRRRVASAVLAAPAGRRRARRARRAADRRRRHAGRDLDPQRLHRPLRGGRRPRARQHRADRGRHARRRLRLDPHQADGRGDEPLDRQRVLRGLGAGGPAAARASGGTVRSTSAADVAIQLSYARLVVVVPGYGMAVAQAQRAVADLAAELERAASRCSTASTPSPAACRAT